MFSLSLSLPLSRSSPLFSFLLLCTSERVRSTRTGPFDVFSISNAQPSGNRVLTKNTPSEMCRIVSVFAGGEAELYRTICKTKKKSAAIAALLVVMIILFGAAYASKEESCFGIELVAQPLCWLFISSLNGEKCVGVSRPDCTVFLALPISQNYFPVTIFEYSIHSTTVTVSQGHFNVRMGWASRWSRNLFL